MAKEHKYKFAKKVYAKQGVESAALAAVSMGFFLISSLISFLFRGNAGAFVGAFALMAMLFSIYGFYLGLTGYSKKDGSHLFCTVGSIANGLLMVIWLALFLIGV